MHQLNYDIFLESKRILGFFWIKTYESSSLYHYLFLPIYMMQYFPALQFFCSVLVFPLIMVYMIQRHVLYTGKVSGNYFLVVIFTVYYYKILITIIFIFCLDYILLSITIVIIVWFYFVYICLKSFCMMFYIYNFCSSYDFV